MNDDIPYSYVRYHAQLQEELQKQLLVAEKAKATGHDPSLVIESPTATDLSDRVAKLLDIPIADRLRELLSQNRTELAALIVTKEVASGKYDLKRGQSPAEAAVRIGLAIVTDGVTVAPIQGISAVRTKQNRNGSEYLSVEFAGPMRSAGGTESAFAVVIADQVRRTLGLEKYNPSSFDDEASRFVEELRIYERDVGSFQYKVSDDDIRKAIENLPVEIDGVWTDNYEVVVHRDLHRLSTNKVRGGALRVLNDGIIGKSKKLLKLLEELGIDDWKWLSELSGGKQQSSDETKANLSHFDEVISGRPVISSPRSIGGLRLRYGRAPNTGIHAVGIHPALPTILDFPIVVGTQIKVDLPGKAATIAMVDTIETPIVKLVDGSVVRIKDVEQASVLGPRVQNVLHLGDILISYGDFLENNQKLVPSPYVEEWWVQDFKRALNRRYSMPTSATHDLAISEERLQSLCSDPLRVFPTFREALRISKIMGVPLHPKYLFFWDLLTPQEVLDLKGDLTSTTQHGEKSLETSKSIKPILERLGVEHSIKNDYRLVISDADGEVLATCLGIGDERIPEGWTNTIELVSKISGIDIRSKSSLSIGVRVGRPEKAMPRQMRPPVQGLFPVGRSNQHRLSRDILGGNGRRDSIDIDIVNLECPKCQTRLTRTKCQDCGSDAQLFFICAQCGRREEGDAETSGLRKCQCGGIFKPWSTTPFPIRSELKKASQRISYEPKKPLKGVLGLSNELKIPEALEKVILRQKYGLTVYRDGTIRYDATNVPLTHFKPKQIQTNIKKLVELGYTKDIEGKSLERGDQTLELFAQDIIIPFEAGTFLVSIAKYIDELLVHHYSTQEDGYYNVETPEDLMGHLVVGLAPHTSVGVVGRIIGYTNAQACFATPYWHSAKRRDCDGDGDSLILLMDVLLNFSRKFLPSIIGGLMDAPLLIQPLVLPKEVQRQAHHMDISSVYPVEFYEATNTKAMPSEVSAYIEVVKKRLNTPEQYTNFGFTHTTNTITIRRARASYSTLQTLTEKLARQIELAEKISAVNVNDVVRSVLRTHLLPDIIGNTKAFTAQRFRCKICGARFRRIPIRGNCLSCGGELQPSVTRGSVEKYLQLGLKLSAKYDVGDYLRSRFVLASEELATLFKPEALQTELGDFTESEDFVHLEESIKQEFAAAKSSLATASEEEESGLVAESSSLPLSVKDRKKGKGLKPRETNQQALF